MFFELIAAIFAAVAAAGVVLLLNRLSGGRLPRWLMPAVAAAAMIGVTVRLEYTWFERRVADFPEGIVVTETHTVRQIWRPWTFAFPLVDRFIAIEPAAVRTNDGAPHQRMTDLLLFARWQPPRVVPMVYDCSAGRSAPLTDSVTYDAAGAVDQAAWAPVEPGDTTFEMLCREPRP